MSSHPPTDFITIKLHNGTLKKVNRRKTFLNLLRPRHLTTHRRSQGLWQFPHRAARTSSKATNTNAFDNGACLRIRIACINSQCHLGGKVILIRVIRKLSWRGNRQFCDKRRRTGNECGTRFPDMCLNSALTCDRTRRLAQSECILE